LAIAAGTLSGETLARLVVGVYSAQNGRLLYRVTAHLTGGLIGGGTRPLSLTTSVDGRGEVLVTEIEHTPPPGGARGFGWWATPASPHEHPLPDVLTVEAGPSSAPTRREEPLAAAALSAGRIAYVTDERWGEKIELLDLRTDRTRTDARFLGEVGVLGLDLSSRELAWAQQRRLPEGRTETTPTRGSLFECNVVALGEPQLTSVDLGSIPSAGLTVGPSLSAANTPPCTDFEK
jgi:hypothetical protein